MCTTRSKADTCYPAVHASFCQSDNSLPGKKWAVFARELEVVEVPPVASTSPGSSKASIRNRLDPRSCIGTLFTWAPQGSCPYLRAFRAFSDVNNWTSGFIPQIPVVRSGPSVLGRSNPKSCRCSVFPCLECYGLRQFYSGEFENALSSNTLLYSLGVWMGLSACSSVGQQGWLYSGCMQHDVLASTSVRRIEAYGHVSFARRRGMAVFLFFSGESLHSATYWPVKCGRDMFNFFCT